MSDGVEVVPSYTAVLRGVFCLRFFGLSGPSDGYVITVNMTAHIYQTGVNVPTNIRKDPLWFSFFYPEYGKIG